MSQDDNTSIVPSVASTAASSMSSVTFSATGGRNTVTGGRTAEVPQLKVLKAPEEGGTKKEYEDFLERICNHVTITWNHGTDIGTLIKTNKKPMLSPPADLTASEEKSRFKVRKWELQVDKHLTRLEYLEENCNALFSLVTDTVSKITKAKLKSKQGYVKAEQSGDAEWLLETLEDIMLNFEDITPKALAMDDHIERIIKLRQGTLSNEDYIKVLQKGN